VTSGAGEPARTPFQARAGTWREAPKEGDPDRPEWLLFLYLEDLDAPVFTTGRANLMREYSFATVRACNQLK